MSRIFNRPMFRRGGSAGEGITSGLARPGYSIGNRVTAEEILKEYGPSPKSGSNINDFLINWGLNMAGNAPSGNIFQTAAKEAQVPFAELSKSKGEGELRDYAAKIQATDKARDINLKLDLAAMEETGYKKYGVEEPRGKYTMDRAKLNMNTQGGSPIDQLRVKYPNAMATFDAAGVYDTQFENLELAPVAQKKNQSGELIEVVDLQKMADISDAEKKIFWDNKDEEWFTVKFEKGAWQINETRKPSISNDPTENFADKALQELQNTIDATTGATTIQDEVEVEESDVSGSPVTITKEYAIAEAKKRGITIISLEEKGSRKTLPSNQKTINGMIRLLEKEKENAFGSLMKEKRAAINKIKFSKKTTSSDSDVASTQ